MSDDNIKPERSLTGYGDSSSSTALEEPFIKHFADLPGEDELPSVENDYARAKAYLMKQCTETGDNLWDHLNELLKKILSERPRNVADSFEEFSLKIRESRFRDRTDHLRDVFVPPEHYELSQKLMLLLQGGGDGVDVPQKNEDDEEQKSQPDLMEMLFYFEQAGVGLPKDEMFCIALHIKKLVNSLPITNYRFWGKILGLHKNYYIAETEFNEEEISKRNAEAEAEEERMKAEKLEKEMQEKEEEAARREQELEEAKQKEAELEAQREESLMKTGDEGADQQPSKPWPAIPALPKPVKKDQPEVPPEPTGVGVNKKTYFVCNCPADEWIELPNVTPQQIVAARKIKRFFTGNLDSEVITFPKFPGTEKNYLRAQIARISSGTQISPLGFYTFNEEEETEAEEEGGKTNFIENPDFEPVSLRDLVDSSMSFWVHHTQYILKQGRTIWWNPGKGDEEGAEEEEEAAADEEEAAEKEEGPELLTPLSEDAALDSTPPWSVRNSSSLLPEFAVAVVRSNLWPGAYAFAVNKTFENIYIGFGHKYSTYNHTPMAMAEIQEEYPLGPEIMEIPDPTVEEEEDWRLAHEPKIEGGEEGGEEEEEEVRDDEDEEEEEEEE